MTTKPIELKTKAASENAKLLVDVLSDEFNLYVKTRNFHWNVTGPHFAELHKLFQVQYTALELNIDELAERIRILGFAAPGSMKEFLSNTRVKENEGALIDHQTMLEILAGDYDTFCNNVRGAITAISEATEDHATVDLLTKMLVEHEKTMWMLRSYAGTPAPTAKQKKELAASNNNNNGN